MTAGEAPRAPRERLLWLDIARVLSAVMILGFHWLRPGYTLGLFGASGYNMVMSYQWNTAGFGLFHDVFIAGFTPNLSTWLSNLIGILGGFGWEAVSAFILISGYSLALSQRNKTLTPGEWVTWFQKRATRILVPFYLVALPCLALAACAIVGLHYVHGSLATVLDAKVHSQFHTSLLGVAISHIFLFDPFESQWSPNFFVPAWWFIPAILLAYLTYPFVRRASRVGHGIPLLAASAAITIGAYLGSGTGFLVNESWYFIVLHESFNFSFGVVIASRWLGAGRPALERSIDSGWMFVVALVVFVLGNLCNWNAATRPVASMLFGPSLAFILVYLGKRLEPWQHASKLLAVDPYDLYLVHQPFAFPIALLAKMVFHSYALFFGWFVFLAVAAAASRVLTLAQRAFYGMPDRIFARVRVRLRGSRPLVTDEAR